MLVEETLFGTHDKVQIAIDRLRTFEPPEGYYLAFSGGKDSQTVYHLCREAGIIRFVLKIYKYKELICHEKGFYHHPLR